MERIVLAYSGGLHASIAITWLTEQFNAEIIAVTMDVGQRSDLVEVRKRALALGAVRCHVVDVREDLVGNYILRALQAGALSDGSPLTMPLEQAVLVRKLVDVARMEGATAIAHGCTPGTDDFVRFEAAAQALAPSVKVIAPAQLWSVSSAEKSEYARAHNIPIPATGSAWTTHSNLWGRSIAPAGPDDLWVEPSEDVFALTRPAPHCPDQAAYIEVEFKAGVPIRANGIEMPLLEMIESLETIAGAHGVGRIDTIEHDAAGIKFRRIYEAPAAVVLRTAYRQLQKLVIAHDLERQADPLGRTYADLVNSGQWFSHGRESIDAFVTAIQPRVTGSIRLRLFKGDCRVVGRKSQLVLDEESTPRLADEQFDHRDARALDVDLSSIKRGR